MNLPNKLTFTRILLVPFILLFVLPMPQIDLFENWNNFIESYGQLVALLLFAAASITDMYDGKIARRQNLVTNLGKFLDPIADKMLVVSVLIALVQIDRINALVPIIVIIREFIVTGIRLVASDKGVVISASNLGKIKTVTQLIAIMIMLAEKTLVLLTSSFISAEAIVMAGDVAMFIAVLMTLISGVDYLIKNYSYLKE